MAHPADLAGKFLEGVQTGSQIRQAQQRLEQQQREAQQRLEAEARKSQEEQAVQQQRIAVAASYNNQMVQLRKQQLDQVEKVNAEKTATAARAFQARQEWDRGFAAIDANQSLTHEQKDAEKTRFTMRLAPLMGIPGTEAAAMLREMRPPKPTVPASVQDMPDFVKVTQPNGQVTLHPKPRQAAEKDPNVKVILQEDVPPTTMPKSQAIQVIKGLSPELRVHPVNQAVIRGAVQEMQKGLPASAPQASAPQGSAPAGDQSEYKSAEEVKSAYRAGKISRANAKKVLVEQFGLKE